MRTRVFPGRSDRAYTRGKSCSGASQPLTGPAGLLPALAEPGPAGWTVGLPPSPSAAEPATGRAAGGRSPQRGGHLPGGSAGRFPALSADERRPRAVPAAPRPPCRPGAAALLPGPRSCCRPGLVGPGQAGPGSAGAVGFCGRWGARALSADRNLPAFPSRRASALNNSSGTAERKLNNLSGTGKRTCVQ